MPFYIELSSTFPDHDIRYLAVAGYLREIRLQNFDTTRKEVCTKHSIGFRVLDLLIRKLYMIHSFR